MFRRCSANARPSTVCRGMERDEQTLGRTTRERLPPKTFAYAHVVPQVDDRVTASEHVRNDVTVDASLFPSPLPTVEVLRRPLESAQYASHDYQKALMASGITCSMSRKGNCWDNAFVESFFATSEKELIYTRGWPNDVELKGVQIFLSDVQTRKSEGLC